MSQAQLDYLLTQIRKLYFLRSSPNPPSAGFQGDLTEAEAQWLLKRDYIRYSSQDENNWTVWRPGERIRDVTR